MSSCVSSLPCLTPAPALLFCGKGDTQQRRSHRFVWQVCNESRVMTLHTHQMVVFSLDPSVMFLFYFSSLCSAQAAPGEVARRHIRPCAHYTCINSIRKSSGQTFQSSAFNSSLGRLCCQPGHVQGAWTCAFIPLFSSLIPTALHPHKPRATRG